MNVVPTRKSCRDPERACSIVVVCPLAVDVQVAWKEPGVCSDPDARRARADVVSSDVVVECGAPAWEAAPQPARASAARVTLTPRAKGVLTRGLQSTTGNAEC